MLADPQNITIDGTAVVAPRHLTGTALGQFISGDNNVALEVQTDRKGRTRTVARLRVSAVVNDVLVPTTKVVVSDTIALTINRPSAGFTDEQVVAQVKAFIAWLTAGTDLNLKKIVAGEN